MALVGFLFEEPPLVLLELTMNILSLMVNKLSPRFVFERQGKNCLISPGTFPRLVVSHCNGIPFLCRYSNRKEICHSLSFRNLALEFLEKITLANETKSKFGKKYRISAAI